jgi:putative transposase
MLAALLQGVRRLSHRVLHALSQRLRTATAPSSARLVVDTLTDLPRSKGELIAENALLRQQIVVLQRNVKRVHCTPTDRALLVVLASRVQAWRHARKRQVSVHTGAAADGERGKATRPLG